MTQSDLMVKLYDHNEWRRHCITASSLITPIGVVYDLRVNGIK